MNDFREYSKVYNNYLEHNLPYAEDYLCHHGILGMHWGIRRYQNPDGTLTQAGKARYDNLKSKAINRMNQLAKEKGYAPGKYYDTTDKKYKKLMKKANKYGTETPEEKSERIQKETQKAIELNKQKIDAANKIDLKEVRNTAPLTDEIKDKWEDAELNDKYDSDFLEITQNDYDDMPEDAARKQCLKDYADYLNAKEVSKMVVNKHDHNNKELIEAADLGLKAMNKLDPSYNDSKPGDAGSRDWFIYEDQTIGCVEVADLCKKISKEYANTDEGVKIAKSQVVNTLDKIKDNKFIDHFSKNGNEGLWDLDYFDTYSVSGRSGANDYIDAIFAILQAEGKIQHSAVEEVFQKFGII